jgi:hypothetical protein
VLARVLSIERGPGGEKFEEKVNEWLAEAGSIKIESVTPIGDYVLIFYSESSVHPAKVKPVLCTQCRKKPPMDGLKICEGCRDYQADYRQKRKDEKKVRYP